MKFYDNLKDINGTKYVSVPAKICKMLDLKTGDELELDVIIYKKKEEVLAK